MKNIHRINGNIYITNDEEINHNTKPCWCLNTIKKTWNDDVIYFQGAMPQYHYIGFKKIILTTDQDLIKDGVQAIDDEFLEWICKNPSCEEVEVKKSWFGTSASLDGTYKIIVPKEEPKQETLEEVALNYAKQPLLVTTKDGFIDGAKWQQQQNKNLYNEEDLEQAHFEGKLKKQSFKEWFEQFKKK